jgi:hypothetical protein
MGKWDLASFTAVNLNALSAFVLVVVGKGDRWRDDDGRNRYQHHAEFGLHKFLVLWPSYLTVNS